MIIKVNELIKQLEEIRNKGLGDYAMYVPAECGYTGAYITEGYEVKENYILLFSDDM